VIYDAEDRPETDQLRKAVAAFRALPRDVACLQARLNFYNAKENLLTKMFTGDYCLWFDFLLPGLERIGVPMPLGGTSNHFRFAALSAIHGWDPFNVTEDADLGIRLARRGMRVRTLDSTTFEEATTGFGNWLRQRSRWQKGYIQTWLVHMRDPAQLMRNAGFWGFVSFQLFIGGTFMSSLLNPVLWLCILAAAFFGLPGAGHLCVACLIVGNGFFVCLMMLGPCRRGWFGLAPYGLLAPFYWALISLAGYRGLWQLAIKPWHWDKTGHGLSRLSAS
jgi:cellulose synthase/poly-beta-1,6-N-acetylglucosamine synthase-like glycosyltransferase